MLHCTKTIEVEIFHDFYKRNTFSFSLYNGLGYLFKGFFKVYITRLASMAISTKPVVLGPLL